MEIEINDDFDLRRIHESGQCFRWEPVGERGFRIPHREACLRIEPRGERTWQLDCTAAEFDALWRDYFDLDEDYAHIRARIDPESDPFLFRASEQEKGIRILRQDLWETLVSFILSQNRSIPVIRRSIALLCRAAGERKIDRAGEAYYTFPAPEALSALSDAALADCRLGYRCRYVKAAAQWALEGGLDGAAFAGLSDEEAMAALTGICGVGIKVASCVSLFGLHRTDAFPVDTWMRRVLETEYPQGYPMERYRPYNGVYQQYMFACYRNTY